MRLFRGIRDFVKAFRFGTRWEAAKDAMEEGRWDLVVERLEEAHGIGMSTDDSRYLLGTAYGKLGRLDECLQELGQIWGPLENARWEAHRQYVYAIALARLERLEECREFLGRIDESRWPEEYQRGVGQLRWIVEERLDAPDSGPPVH